MDSGYVIILNQQTVIQVIIQLINTAILCFILSKHRLLKRSTKKSLKILKVKELLYYKKLVQQPSRIVRLLFLMLRQRRQLLRIELILKSKEQKKRLKTILKSRLFRYLLLCQKNLLLPR